MDLRNMWGGYDRDYYRYNWHGDVSAVMDSNGNGDGWYNVSPFGDNGNGAYPANPDLKQYYGWGGAWGYLYFGGIFGGTNTVRSVDLYYIHGRWWHPDMGIFLSPNAKGDYLYNGDGQDPANYGWATNSAPSVPMQRMPMPAPSPNNPNCDVTALNCTIEQLEQLSIDARVRWMHNFQIVYRTQGWFNNIEAILQSFQEKGLVRPSHPANNPSYPGSYFSWVDAYILHAIQDGKSRQFGTPSPGNNIVGPLWNKFFVDLDQKKPDQDLKQDWGHAEQSATVNGRILAQQMHADTGPLGTALAHGQPMILQETYVVALQESLMEVALVEPFWES